MNDDFPVGSPLNREPVKPRWKQNPPPALPLIRAGYVVITLGCFAVMASLFWKA